MLPLIKCWTVLRHIAHRPHHHIRRVGHHIVAHKAVAAAVPVIVCTTLGGAGWMLPAAPGAGAFGGESGAFGSGGSGGAAIGFGGGGFASGGLPALELPAEFFAAPLLGPSAPPVAIAVTPGTIPAGAFISITTNPAPGISGIPVAPATPETPAQPIPEPTSFAVFAAALAALWVAKAYHLFGERA